ncbi:MAG: VOC family protein [Oscillospiraceae bacterium]|nr:VOC family protein [Oscillospiraceae bacterium]
MLTGIHHTAVIASDYKRSKHFYVDILGFSVLAENFQPHRGTYKLDIALEDCTIELFGMPDAPARVTNPEACGLRHLCFKVNDLDTTIADLSAKGVCCEPVRVDPYTNRRFTFFFDPDGLPLELHE